MVRTSWGLCRGWLGRSTGGAERHTRLLSSRPETKPRASGLGYGNEGGEKWAGPGRT